MGKRISLDLANESDNETPYVLEIENELNVDSDGWALISPYGDFPHHTGWLQRFTIENAKEIVRNFKSPITRFKRFVGFVRGLPLFKGHPDVPGLENTYPDKTVYGTWHALEAREDGLYGQLAATEDGASLVEQGLKFVSPRWLATPLENSRIAQPFKLISVGLTDRPNIPGRSLANEKQQTENIMEKAKLIQLLGLENTATDEQIEAAITQLKGEAGKVTGLENAKIEAESKITTLTTERDQAKTDLENARTEATNERKARIDLILDNAVADGRITPAQRPQWATDLANAEQFDSKVTELANAKPEIKTEPKVKNAGQRNGQLASAKERQAQVSDLVNEKMSKGLSYDAAFAAVKRENKALFENMKQPEVAA